MGLIEDIRERLENMDYVDRQNMYMGIIMAVAFFIAIIYIMRAMDTTGDLIGSGAEFAMNSTSNLPLK